MSEQKEKTSWEYKLLWGDFTSEMRSGETIDANDVIVTDSEGTDVTATVIDENSVVVDDRKLYAMWIGGTKAASPYRIVFRATSSNGQRHEAVARLWVKP